MDAVTLAQDFADSCIRCGVCTRTDCGNYSEGVPCLGDVCESVLNGDQTYFSFAFTCALCNRCTVSCPMDLKAIDCCKPLRAIELEQHPEMRANYRHFRTDLKHNLFSRLLDRTEAGYQLAVGEKGLGEEADATAFFPGCSLSSYAPELTAEALSWLREEGIASVMLQFCCGATFFDSGFFPEFEEYRKKAAAYIEERGIRKIVVTCPHCAYVLPQLLEGTGIELVRLPDLLVERGKKVPQDVLSTYSMHDACYDRYEGVFGTAVRQLLDCAEEEPLAHTGEKALCCGGGGMVSAYAPSFCEYRRNMRLAEMDQVSSDMVVSTCFSCVNSLQRGTAARPVKHYLELVFGKDVDWNGVYNAVDAMYADSDTAGLLNTTESLF